MMLFEYPGEVDFKKFGKQYVVGDVRYGLPPQVRYCTRCVISNQRPNSTVEITSKANDSKDTIHFDNDGVCDACNVSDEKKSVNWLEREQELEELCARHRRNDGKYDCIVPGSGGKDSFYASHILKEKYGMHPLTVTWAPHIYTDWGWKNLQSWIHAGHDNHLVTPNGRVHRLLTRLALERLFHPFQPFMIGQKSIAPKLAVSLGIPLIFYGENEAEYGNPKTCNRSSLQDSKYFSLSDLDNFKISGFSGRELVENFGLTLNDLQPYLPVDQERFDDISGEVHYLGYYLKWHPQSCYYYACENSDFKAAPERTPGTYSKYSSIDDRMDDFHYLTTGLKFGIGRASYDASQEIRSGDITREEGVALVHRFDHEYPARFANEIFDYLSIDPNIFPEASRQFEEWRLNEDYFHRLSDTFRSPHIWQRVDGYWNLRCPVE